MNANTRTRIDRLAATVRPLAIRRQIDETAYRCLGRDLDEVLSMIMDAVPKDEASMAAFDAIMDACKPSFEAIERGDEKPRIHGFLLWCSFLVSGDSTLPATLPLEFLLAWRDGTYEGAQGLMYPVPHRRCEECRLMLPNAIPGGGMPPTWTACPSCGSPNISWADLSKSGYVPLWENSGPPRPETLN